MTEEEVVNVRGDISESGAENGDDQHNIKGEYCNGVAHATEKEKEVNGNGDGKVDGDGTGEFVGGSEAVAADRDSGVSDLIVVVDHNDNGDAAAASEGLQLQLDLENKANGEALDESQLTVSEAAEAESECERQQLTNNDEAKDCADASAVSNGLEEEKICETEISDVTISVDVDVSGENVGRESESEACADAQNGCVEKVRSVSVTDLNESQESENGEEDVVTVVEGVADANKSDDREFESVDVQNGVADAELSECAAMNESPETLGVSVSDANESQECKVIVGADVSGDVKDVVTAVEGVADVNKVHDHESETVVGAADVENGVADEEASECVVEDEIRVDVDGGSVTDVNGIQESENLAVAEVSGDEKDVVTDVKGAADVNKSHKEVESVAAQNGLAETELSKCAEEDEIPVVVDGVSAKDVEDCADGDAQNSSEAEKAQIESVDSGGGDEKDGWTLVEGRSESVSDTDVDKSLECTDVSDKKDVVTLVREVSDVKSHDGKMESVVGVEAQNGLADSELSECTEKNEILVEVDGVSATNVEECADKDAQNSSEVEKAQIESVSDTDVDKSIVGADVQNSLAEPELRERGEENEIPIESEPGSKLEKSEEESGRELVPEGEYLSAVDSAAKTGDGNVVSDRNDDAGESEGGPSADMSAMKNNAVESEAVPSSIAVEREGEPSAKGELSVEGEGGNDGDEDTRPTQEESTTDTLDGQKMGSEVVKRPFYYLIRLPRYDDDDNMKEQIKNALHQVEEKTKIRDAIRAESQTRKASCKEYGQDVRAAISAERAARDLLKSKRQEMDSVQSTMNRLNNAISVGDIDGKIRNMEHMIQHETLPLKEEKQLIRQIKQLKQNREELSSNMGKQDQSQQSVDHKDSIEEHFKQLQLLKKEVELLRNNVLKTEAATKAAKKKYDDECNKLNELLARFKAADDIRQEAYAKLQALRKKLHEKSKNFWEYKNAAKKGQELAAEGKREELQCFCVDQVERIMELWNKNDEFRRDYIRCNTRSTLRRLQTLDGRPLGPDEEPPIIPIALTERASKNNSSISQSTLDQEKKSVSTESVNIRDEPVSKVVEQRNEKSQTNKAKMPAKPAPSEKPLVVVSRWGDEPEDTIEEPVRTKEEEELILKAEIARKEEEAAKLKEKRRLEEIEKAKEAMQRKKRNAEKAQQRAALKAQKEAEQKEKQREKKARKKERRKAASTDTADNPEQESAPSLETLTRSTEECDQSEKPVEVTKRPQKPSQFTRQTKAKSLPLPLRNRGKRRMQPWMWVLIAVLVVVAMFYMGNNSSLRSGLPGFGF